MNSDKASNVRILIEKKSQLGLSMVKKKEKLAQKVGTCGLSLGEICTQFNESKMGHFEHVWSKFMDIKSGVDYVQGFKHKF